MRKNLILALIAAALAVFLVAAQSPPQQAPGAYGPISSLPDSIFGFFTAAPVSFANGTSVCQAPVNQSGNCMYVVLSKGHTLVRFTFQLTVSPAGCTTAAALGAMDATSGTVYFSSTLANAQGTSFVDSGPLSVPMPAGDRLGVGLLTSPAGCTTQPTATMYLADYQ